MPILKLSLRAWRKAPFSQLVALAISSSLLLCVALLICVEICISQTQSRLEKENRFTVFLSPSLDIGDGVEITDRLRQSLGSHAESNVRSKFVSSSETLGILKERYPELYEEVHDLVKDGDPLVPRAVHLTATFSNGSLNEAIQTLRSFPGVESVESTEARNAIILPAVLGLKWLIRLLLVGVSAGWGFGWLSLGRAHSACLMGVSSPLRLWGASSWTARAPSVLSGLWVGLPAGLLAAFAYLRFVRPVVERIALTGQSLEMGVVPGLSAAFILIFMSSLAGMVSGLFSGHAES